MTVWKTSVSRFAVLVKSLKLHVYKLDVITFFNFLFQEGSPPGNLHRKFTVSGFLYKCDVCGSFVRLNVHVVIGKTVDWLQVRARDKTT